MDEQRINEIAEQLEDATREFEELKEQAGCSDAERLQRIERALNRAADGMEKVEDGVD